MVYRSPLYTDFIGRQLSRYDRVSSGGVKVSYRILGNDPAPDVVKALKSWPHTIHRNEDPNELYINRQYKGFNACVETSDADHVCLVNSDMAFHEGWLDALWSQWSGEIIPVSRLVNREQRGEAHELVRDFGAPHRGFDESGWERFALESVERGTLPGGMFMPVIFERSRFLEAGKYPEGNLNNNEDIAEMEDFSDVAVSGDRWFFDKLSRDYGMRHVTVMSSLAYHVREGEKHRK